MSKLRSNRSFVLLFLGRFVTNAGDSLYFIGAMWLVYSLTGSTFYTGLAGFLVHLPSMFRFLIGPLVDRWKLRPILVRTQFIQCICVLIVPLAAATGHLSVWLVLLVMPLLTLVNQFVYPAQTAILPRIVEGEQLVRANSLFSTVYQGTEVVLNAASGIVLAVIGATTLFVVDSATFAITTVLFLGVSVPAMDSESDEDDTNDADDANNANDDSTYVAELREGIEYLRGSVLISMLLGAMVVNVGGGAMTAVLPAFADSMGGPETYGLLMATIAGGSLAGTGVASLVEDRPYGRLSMVIFPVSALGLAAASVVPGLLATLSLLFVAFVPMGVFNVMFSSLLQSSVDAAFLGRVSSVVSSISMGMLPLGTLLGGVAGDVYGPVSMLYLLSGLLVLLALYFLAHPRIRSLPSINETDEATLGLRSSANRASISNVNTD